MQALQRIALFAFFVALSLIKGQPANAGPNDLAVVGDSIATGLYFGIRDTLSKDDGFNLIRHTKGATGLSPDRTYDWIKAAKRIRRNDNPGYVVVALGGNDRQDILIGSKRLIRYSKAWWREYKSRVDRFMKALGPRTSRIFWVSLPAVRNKRMTSDYARLNAVYEEVARANGVSYIDIYTLTALGASGLSRQKLRDDDGIHFTSYGNATLGRIILRTIRQSRGSSS